MIWASELITEAINSTVSTLFWRLKVGKVSRVHDWQVFRDVLYSILSKTYNSLRPDMLCVTLELLSSRSEMRNTLELREIE